MGTPQRLRLAVSQCLLGDPVRYDGASKPANWLLNRLRPHMEFIPICPEVAIGLGVPRPPIQQERLDDGIHVRQAQNKSVDVTDLLDEYALKTSENLQEVSGYVFKKGSPSCGTENVPIYDASGDRVVGQGTGRFAAQIKEHLPLLPIDDEEGLSSQARLDAFLEKIFCYVQGRQLITSMTAEMQRLAHQYKYKLMAHDASRTLRLLQSEESSNVGGFALLTEMLSILNTPATLSGHQMVWRHILEDLEKVIVGVDLSLLKKTCEKGKVPVPIILGELRYIVEKYQVECLLEDQYLWPDSRELQLRFGIC